MPTGHGSPATGTVAGPADAVLDHVTDGADIIVPLANGEPVTVVDALEEGARAQRFSDVRVHQMHVLHDRPYLHGLMPGALRHVSYFLSHVTRPAFYDRACELVPNNFSEVPRLLRETTRCSLVVAAAAPMDRHGYFSLGTNCDYVAPFIGRAPFFLEVNERMPRTFGRNQVHVSQVVGWTEVDRPLVELHPEPTDEVDHAIATLVAERVPDGATIQAGIGSIPNALLEHLRDHRDLGIHTELLSDGLIDLVDRGVVTGTRKRLRTGKIVATFALGTSALYDFLDQNPAVEMLPVDYVNDPRIIGQEKRFVSINATTEVDLVGQCASETVAGRYWSSSGGQADFARGAMFSPRGRAFVVLPSTARGGTVSRIRAELTPGSMVTTIKNTVDQVVTEFGVAEMRGRSISERARALIAVAHPRFRDELTAAGRARGYL
ncbi:MAG TPA: acetyl-CoA hydrolase/transferase C-terminal domain-containing protein [Acidimicrobiales bacterium]|nr:acetyl-CoA hydrolase/transferase C-terminal domain-containing protein [Acidimicrobiales bacterium]